MIYTLVFKDKTRTLELSRTESGWSARLDGGVLSLDVERVDDNTLSLLNRGESFTVRRVPGGGLIIGGRYYEVSVRDRRSWRGRQGRSRGEAGAENVTATMPGKVVRLLAREGDALAIHQGILVVEAMKMQNEIRSPKAGTLKRLWAEPGKSVNAGEVLAVVE